MADIDMEAGDQLDYEPVDTNVETDEEATEGYSDDLTTAEVNIVAGIRSSASLIGRCEAQTSTTTHPCSQGNNTGCQHRASSGCC